MRTERRDEATVSWFELFYDLVVIAAITVANDAFLRDPSLHNARNAVVAIIALAWVWLLTTLFNNISPGNDLIRRVLMLIQMGLIVAAVLTIDRSIDTAGTQVLLAYAGTLAIIPLLIASNRWVTRSEPTPDPRRWTTVAALSVAPILCAAGALVTGPYVAALLGLALLSSGVTVLGPLYREWLHDERLRLDHLSERLGLFIIIILGEGFAQLVHSLSGLDSIPRADVFALVFLVSFALWWIYFDGLVPSGTDLAQVRWRFALLGHLTLVFGIAGTLDILVLLTAGDDSAIGAHVPDYFAGSIATVLVSFALIRYAVTGRLGRIGLLNLGSAATAVTVAMVVDDSGQLGIDLTIGLSAAIVIVNGVATAWSGFPTRTSPGARAAAILRGHG
jgi:low temperature requirement protein LtrA